MPLTFTPDETRLLPPTFSHPRFSTYLKARRGSRSAALRLYRWNMQISAAFLVPLNVAEITLRNAVANAIHVTYGPGWPWNAGFVGGLPSGPPFDDRGDLERAARKYRDADQVVAHLSFSFWQQRLTARHLTDIWHPGVLPHFPHVPLVLAPGVSLTLLHDEVERVRNLRNRIAHHEPIFTRNLLEEYERIVRVIGYRSPEAAGWVDRIQGVTALFAVPL